MESNYYTPEIEEFHEGFEYEAYHNHDWFFLEGAAEWVSTKLSPDQPPYVVPSSILNTAISQGWVRVKYLDQEDIESFGFELQTHKKCPFGRDVYYIDNPDKLGFNTGFMYTIHHSENRPDVLQLMIEGYSSYSCPKYQMEYRVKNKSELKKLLKQVGYED